MAGCQSVNSDSERHTSDVNDQLGSSERRWLSLTGETSAADSASVFKVRVSIGKRFQFQARSALIERERSGDDVTCWSHLPLFFICMVH